MISSLFAIGIFWYAVQNIPGLLETVGYVYGILVASFSFEAIYSYIESDLE